MVIANFLAGAHVVPAWLKHAPDVGLTVIDLIAPAFVFAIGLTYVQSVRGRIARDGALRASEHFVARNAALIGLGMMFSIGEARFQPVPGRDAFWGVLQALGFAGLVALPIARTPTWGRGLVAVALLAGYQLALDSLWRDRVLHSSHGGLEGAVAWTAMLLAATVLADLRDGTRTGTRYLAAAALVLVAGLALAFVFPISKNRVSSTYVLVAIGICAFVFAAFERAPAALAARVPVLGAWGLNPLLLYVLHQVALSIFVLPESPGWYVEAPGWLVAIQLSVLLAAFSALAVTLARRRWTFAL